MEAPGGILAGWGITKHYSSGPNEEIWECIQQLGRGGHGDVSLERCVSDPVHSPARLRAVKSIKKRQWGFGNPPRELDTLAVLSDPLRPHYPEASLRERYFVMFFGWYENMKNIFIAMEYVPYGTLDFYIHKQAPGEYQSSPIILQIARALRFMHEGNLVHRDLKPLNILVVSPGPFWRVKVADFGITKNIEFTQMKTLEIGTPGYKAPEVLRPGNSGSSKYTAAVDIWALGAIAFCACTERRPFKDDHETDDFARGLMDFPRSALSECDQATTNFIMAAMAKEEKHRPTVHQLLSYPWIKRCTTYVDDLYKEQDAETDSFSSPEHSWDAPASNAWSYEADETSYSRGTWNSYVSNPTSGSTYKPYRRQNGSEPPTSRPLSTSFAKERHQETAPGSQHSFQSSEVEVQRLRSQLADLSRQFAEFQQRSQESNPAPSTSQSSQVNPSITGASTDVKKSPRVPHGIFRSDKKLRDNQRQSGSLVSNPDRPNTNPQHLGSYSTNGTNLKDNTWDPAEPRNGQISQATPNPKGAMSQRASIEQSAYQSNRAQPPRDSQQQAPASIQPSTCTQKSCEACMNKWSQKRRCLRCGQRIVPRHLLHQHLREKGHYIDLKTHKPMELVSQVRRSDKAQPPKGSRKEPSACIRPSCMNKLFDDDAGEDAEDAVPWSQLPGVEASDTEPAQNPGIGSEDDDSSGDDDLGDDTDEWGEEVSDSEL